MSEHSTTLSIFDKCFKCFTGFLACGEVTVTCEGYNPLDLEISKPKDQLFTVKIVTVNKKVDGYVVGGMVTGYIVEGVFIEKDLNMKIIEMRRLKIKSLDNFFETLAERKRTK